MDEELSIELGGAEIFDEDGVEEIGLCGELIGLAIGLIEEFGPGFFSVLGGFGIVPGGAELGGGASVEEGDFDSLELLGFEGDDGFRAPFAAPEGVGIAQALVREGAGVGAGDGGVFVETTDGAEVGDIAAVADGAEEVPLAGGDVFEPLADEGVIGFFTGSGPGGDDPAVPASGAKFVGGPVAFDAASGAFPGAACPTHVMASISEVHGWFGDSLSLHLP